MSAGNDNRLTRWSRLKRKRARGEAAEDLSPRAAAVPVVAPAPDSPPVPAEGAAGAPDEPERELTAEEAAYVETLPAVEDLTADSDYSVFLDRRVPDFIRRQALRKLWLSDPAFGFMDGMHEYGEDYSMMAQLAAGATSYRPDQGGYAWKDKPVPEDGETEAAAATEGDNARGAVEGGAAEQAGDMEESVSAKARRVQDRGGSSVSLPTYTANPYYQTPGQRQPAPEAPPESARPQLSKIDADSDGLGDAEDDLA